MLWEVRLWPFAILLVTSSVFARGGAVRAAGNTVPAPAAGDRNSSVSGYTISAIAYNPNGANFQNLDSLTFTAIASNGSLAAAFSITPARFGKPIGWYTCTRIGGVALAHRISCDTTAPQDTFTVVIIK